jgi:hypothetical protein
LVFAGLALRLMPVEAQAGEVRRAGERLGRETLQGADHRRGLLEMRRVARPLDHLDASTGKAPVNSSAYATGTRRSSRPQMSKVGALTR